MPHATSDPVLDEMFRSRQGKDKVDGHIEGLYVRLGLVDKEILDLHRAVATETIEALVIKAHAKIFDRLEQLLTDCVSILGVQEKAGREGRFPTAAELGRAVKRGRKALSQPRPVKPEE
jgi:hypothetical protein